MNASEAQAKQKRIEDLTLNQLDMVYSLSRTGWSCPEIGRRYGISDAEVRRAVDNYVDLRSLCQERSTEEGLHRRQEQEVITKRPRKRRSDSLYATTKERQAAYRARLQESRRASLEQPSRASETDTPIPDVEELSVTACEAPVTEAGPEEAKTQQSACYSSSEVSGDISESVPLPVTPKACSEREELQVIEE